MTKPRRVPVFVGPQAECETCGKQIRDALAIEQLGRFCSERCYHSRGLAVRFRLGA